MGAPDAARDILDSELAAPLEVRHVRRLSFPELPPMQDRATLLLIFGSRDEIRFAAQILKPLATTTVLLARDDDFGYRELNDIIDLIGQGPG